MVSLGLSPAFPTFTTLQSESLGFTVFSGGGKVYSSFKLFYMLVITVIKLHTRFKAVF